MQEPRVHDSTPVEVSDTPAVSPTVFPPGRLDEEALQALSPRQLLESHHSSAGLSESVIMMVDDELLNIEMTEAFLLEAGYTHFTSTTDSRTAIDRMRQQPPAVVLLDLSMPHVSGMDILEDMRRDKALRHIPVIVLTSTIEPAVKLQALGAGAMDFLSKPVDPSELALRLRNTLAATAYRDFLAHHDPLTGLQNSERYQSYARQAVEAGQAGGWSAALVHVGIDKLGPINDALGRSIGDQVLQRVAKRLASSVETEVGGELASPQQDPALFRFDGDEFAVVLPHVEHEDIAAAFISKLLEDSASSFSRGGNDLFVTCSIGIALSPQDGSETADLVGKASLAMRKAKQAGRHRYEFFAPEFNRAAVSHLGKEVELRRAFSRQQVELRYEPRLDARTGHVAAAEALLYWRKPSGEAVFGEVLGEMAGSADLGAELAEWTLERVRLDLADWRSQGLALLPVRLAVSLAQVAVRDLHFLVRGAVGAGLEPGLLVIELQQGPALDALASAERDALDDLARAGITLAVGGFGTGQSSLAGLAALPFAQARLGAGVMRGVGVHARADEFARAAIRMVRALGWQCVVPGVASLEQLELVRAEGAQQYTGAQDEGPLTPAQFAARRQRRPAA